MNATSSTLQDRLNADYAPAWRPMPGDVLVLRPQPACSAKSRGWRALGEPGSEYRLGFQNANGPVAILDRAYRHPLNALGYRLGYQHERT
jgi:hypothetical protein